MVGHEVVRITHKCFVKKNIQKVNKQVQCEIGLLQLVNNPFTNLTMVNFHTGYHASGTIDDITESKTIETFWAAKFYHTMLTIYAVSLYIDIYIYYT